VRAGDTLLVAVSGGLDSLVLLHLLRFNVDLPAFGLQAAHFDHRMRRESEEDALWVRGLCRAWDVPLALGAAQTTPQGEEEARARRYEFLAGARDRLGADWLLTAHHADDQAETVLFRTLRGTGLRGLAGIPRHRSPGILRPLLSFSRTELEVYARATGIRAREDPTNSNLAIPRNYIRHVALPGLEESVAGGARAGLRRLARLAEENERAWESLVPGLLDGLVKEEEGEILVVRSSLLTYHPTVQARMLRAVVRRRGVELSEAGTRKVLEFTRIGASGRSIPLPGGLRLYREFDRFRLAPSEDPGTDTPLVMHGSGEGAGELIVGGRRFAVRWGGPDAQQMEMALPLSPGRLRFPLRLRRWAPGDRIRLPYGTKKVKKLLREAGIPLGERRGVAVLVDAEGEVLWVAGLAVSVRARPRETEAPFFVGIGNVDQS